MKILTGMIQQRLVCGAAVLVMGVAVPAQTPDATERRIRMLEVGAPKRKARAAKETDAGPPLTDRQIAHHVLNRLAFGPRPGQVDQVFKVGWEQWARQQLRPRQIDDPQVKSAMASRWPSMSMSMGEVFDRYMPPYPSEELSLEEQRRLTERRNALRQEVMDHLVESVLYRAIYSERQFEQVIVEFWRNHFNVDHTKDDVRYLANHYEEQVLRKHAFGKFEDLLLATAQHPAMLIYLDNVVSQKPLSAAEQRLVARYEGRARMPRSVQARARHRGLNENYARELMELHTLGVDNHYTQHDVIDLSRALTGWTADWNERGRGDGQKRDYGFHFRREVHDEDKKVVLGTRLRRRGGVEEGQLIIRRLARHPGTARFISWKLCRYLVRDEPPEPLVREVAQVFRRSGGDLPTVYEAIIFSDDFLYRQNYRSKFKTPFEFVVASLRATDARVERFDGAIGALNKMGQRVYGCEDPTGYYDQAEAWLDPGVLVYRWEYALRLAEGQMPGVSFPDVFGESSPPRSTDQLKQALVSRLLPGGLDPQSDAQLAELIGQSPSPRRALGLVLGSPPFQQQ